jgi:hypothetical protein
MVRLSCGKMTKMFLVHRLVAQAFLPNPNNLPVVMHKDNNKYNNHVSNLKWGTYSENTLQACRDGLVNPPYEYNKLTWILFNPDCPVYIESRGIWGICDRTGYSDTGLHSGYARGIPLRRGPYKGWKLYKTDVQRSSDDVGGIYPLM